MSYDYWKLFIPALGLGSLALILWRTFAEWRAAR